MDGRRIRTVWKATGTPVALVTASGSTVLYKAGLIGACPCLLATIISVS